MKRVRIGLWHEGQFRWREVQIRGGPRAGRPRSGGSYCRNETWGETTGRERRGSRERNGDSSSYSKKAAEHRCMNVVQDEWALNKR